MPQITADRVKETSTTTGTGSYTLAGAAAGFRAFSAVCANGDTAYYTATDGTGWEVGLGTWATGGTLARTRIIASSNAGAAVSWAAGTRDVFLTAAAEQVAKSIRRHEWTGTYAYCGRAPEGSAESATVWTITRLTISAAGAVTATAYASGVAWTNRASATYA